MKAGALLATNTSSIMLEPLAASSPNPARLVGLHFFNPVAQMPLVEIVHAAGTDRAGGAGGDRLRAAARQAAGAVQAARPGFLVNRVLTPYLYEAMLAAQEGVPLAAIDRRGGANSACRWDRSSWPTSSGSTWPRTWARSRARARQRTVTQIARLDELIAAKKLGRKSGAGFYSWQDGKPPSRRPQRRPPADLIDRMILVMVNECVACLRERRGGRRRPRRRRR